MTKLEEVLAEEEWTTTGRGGLNIRNVRSSVAMRAHIHCLGKRALALILKHEFCSLHWSGTMCSECEQDVEHSGGVHTSDCEWGKIVAEAKALG
jgi:hypothetical protein